MTFRGTIGRIAMLFFGLFPIQNKIVFSSFDGKNFGDNPKAIFEELRAQGIKSKLIWFMYDDSLGIDGADVVKAYSMKALYHQATAKVWIFNSRQRYWMKKRKGQLYIQTWRGGLCLKKIEGDAENKLPKYYIDEAKHDSQMADYLVSASEWNTKQYRRAFWYSGKIIEQGLPRSDVFFNNDETYKEKIISSLGANDSKIVLYAPTFRNDGDYDYLNIDSERILRILEKKWPGRWILVYRLHPNIQRDRTRRDFSKKIIDGSDYPDINDLVIVSELLITDYSSCMFDALEMGKKTILYTPDYQEYCDERGTYFTLNELPFPHSFSSDELIEAIAQFDEATYLKKRKIFLDECKSFNSGTASKEIVKIIVEHLR